MMVTSSALLLFACGQITATGAVPAGGGYPAAPAVLAAAEARDCSWWYEETAHHGFAFRNVSAFGAVGDGVADGEPLLASTHPP